MNPKIAKLRTEFEKNKNKISDLQGRNRELEKQIRELEDTDIIGMVLRADAASYNTDYAKWTMKDLPSRRTCPAFQNTTFVFCGDWGGASTSTKLSVSAKAEIGSFRKVGTALHCSSRSCPAISQEIRNISLDVIRNENIIYLDNNLRSDGIVWNWRRL